MVQIDAMAVHSRPHKRPKQRIMADLQDFLTFPAANAGAGEGFDGPFRLNVRLLISRLARILTPPTYSAPELRAWHISYGVDHENVELDVVEEDVERSKKNYCDHCRIAGWSGNPVCRKRYHFIIRNENSPVYRQTCTHCGVIQHWSETRCTSCNHELTVSTETWSYLHLEDANHLLHGVVHANGYGHLLRINGREGGSRLLTGCNLMEFWDRFCKLLHVRKVTVMDVSKKYGMEYRLLHAIMTDHSWYGNWGYEFGVGSFAATAADYRQAVYALSNTQLSIFNARTHSQLHSIIGLYQSLSNHKLEIVRDLFCFMTDLLKDSHEKKQVKECNNLEKKMTTAPIACLWREEDVQQAIKTLIRILQAVNKSQWVTWRALRGATFRSIGSSELLDYCLKKLSGVSTDDGFVVATRCNPEAKTVEYRLEHAPEKTNSEELCRPSREQLLHDLKFMYDALLNPATTGSYYPQTSQQIAASSALKLLDCKHFIKHYDNAKDFMHSNPFSLAVWCHLELPDKPKDYVTPPSELIVLPLTATFTDFKLEATKTFQDTYLVFHGLQVELIANSELVTDDTQINSMVRSNDTVQVRGRCFKNQWMFEQFRMERGNEDWTVDCTCGSKDDDGERMLACDNCGVWQHTRCSGIKDYEEVPEKFVCRLCSTKVPKRQGKGSKMYRKGIKRGRCQLREAPLASGTNRVSSSDVNCVNVYNQMTIYRGLV